MTLCIAYIENGTAYMASDSRLVQDSQVWHMSGPKYFELGKGIWCMWAGNPRFYQRAIGTNIACTVEGQPEWENVVRWAVPIQESFDEKISFDCMVVTRERIFSIDQDAIVVELSSKYMAIGIARGIALGALFSLNGTSIDPKEKIRIAMNAGLEWDSSVGGKIHIKSF